MVRALSAGCFSAEDYPLSNPTGMDQLPVSSSGMCETEVDKRDPDPAIILPYLRALVQVQQKRTLEEAGKLRPALTGNLSASVVANNPDGPSQRVIVLRTRLNERIKELESAAAYQEGKIEDLHRVLCENDLDVSNSGSDFQTRRIRHLQNKIQEVETQASIRQIQARVLEIKIRQVELLVLVKQAQQVVDLRGRENALLARKHELEERISTLQSKIHDLGSSR